MRRPFSPASVALLALLALAPAAQSPAQSAFAPIAVVNDSPITGFDLDQRMRLLAFNGAPQGARLRDVALDQLIDDRLKREAGRRSGGDPASSDVDEMVDRFAAARGLDRAALAQRLEGAGVAMSALTDALAADVAWRNAIRRRFASRAEPSEIEIDQEIALAQSGRVRSFRIAEIVIPNAGRGPDAARAQAERIADDLAGGADFAATARRTSAAPSAARGGEVGWTPEGNLPPAALAEIERLSPGQVSRPIEVPGGVALLRLIDSRSDQAPWAGEPTLELLMLAGPARTDAAARESLSPLAAGGCASAETAAQAAGVRAERPPRAPLSQLPPDVRDAVATLGAGEASAPVRGQQGYAVFIVCARESGVTPEARARLRDQLRDRRLIAFAEGYLQELRGEAVVERR